MIEKLVISIRKPKKKFISKTKKINSPDNERRTNRIFAIVPFRTRRTKLNQEKKKKIY